MDITSVFNDSLMPLAVALYVSGVIMKQSKSVPDRFIPVILLVIGIVGSLGMMPIQGTASITDAIIQGILATGMTIMTNQAYKQLTDSTKK